MFSCSSFIRQSFCFTVDDLSLLTHIASFTSFLAILRYTYQGIILTTSGLQA